MKEHNPTCNNYEPLTDEERTIVEDYIEQLDLFLHEVGRLESIKQNFSVDLFSKLALFRISKNFKYGLDFIPMVVEVLTLERDFLIGYLSYQEEIKNKYIEYLLHLPPEVEEPEKEKKTMMIW